MTSLSSLAPKPVNASAVENYLYKVFPKDLNASNTLFGGKIMSALDIVASIVAENHTHQNCVTAAADSIYFLNSAKQGDVLTFKASVNKTWYTSMEIGVCVSVNNYKLVYSHHLVSAYFIFVAIDNNHNPIPVPPVIPETALQRYRYEEAEHRRLHRQKIISRKSAKGPQISQQP